MMVALAAPMMVPMIAQGAMRINTGQSILPRRWCAKVDDMAVKIITVSDVPAARCMMMACGRLNKVKIKARAGTTIAPPPIPSIPATVPAIAPASTKSIKSNNNG